MMSKQLKCVVIFALMTCVPPVVTAQERTAPPMTAERSRTIQVQLQAIEADRAAFASRLLSEWSLYLDNSKYNLQEELGDALARAPAWQLYGASLVGDFRTMVEILRGVRPAGPYINTLTAPQAKSSLNTAGFPSSSATELPLLDAPQAFGSNTEQLVFTPISPCRLVDTRGSGARAGLMAAGSMRTFDLTTAGLSKGQGGTTNPALCPGLPTISPHGWAVNITVTGYSAFGWLTAWGYGGTEPTASVINYSASISPAVANGVSLIGCYNCAEDIVIRAAAAGTHVIVDVVGYYSAPTVSTATVTRMAGTTVTLAANGQDWVYGGACPAGTRLIGGEVGNSNWSMPVSDSLEWNSTTWNVYVWNQNAASETSTVWSRCLDAPVKVP